MIHKIQNDDMQKALECEVAVVDFSATWCGPCQMLAPVLEKISEEMAGKVEFFNADTDENTSLAIQNGITNIPALLLMKNGKTVDIKVGFTPENELKNWILGQL